MTLSKTSLILLILVNFTNVFCQNPIQSRYDQNEKFFNTDKQDVFHQYAVPKININKSYDGVILAFEKIPGRKIASSEFNLQSEENIYNIDFRNYWTTKYDASGKKIKRYKQIAKWNKTILKDPKSIVLTHWLNYSNGQYNADYNIYNDNYANDTCYNLYSNTKTQLDEVKKLLAEKISKGNYTHVLFMCTGWNNHQFESLARYEGWLQAISNAAKANGQAFRPFFIGVTWPAYWFNNYTDKSMVDLPNKANDADELGLTHINYFLWQCLLPVTNQHKVPLVLIGHSFGARMLTRASHSSFYFKNMPDTTHKIDLMIAFQGAYALDRHLLQSTRHGIFKKRTTGAGLYREAKPWKYFAATTSRHDGAFQTLNGSKLGYYTGGAKAFTFIEKNPDKSDFAPTVVNPNGTIDIANNTQSNMLILNADNIIVKGHGDVTNENCGRLIWQLMTKACKSGN